jgi:hypothetical protein
MALRKTKEVNSTGVTGEYWRITDYSMDLLNYDSTSQVMSVRVCISLYKDDTSRTSGKNLISNEVYIFTDGFDLVTLGSKNPVQRAYEKLKSDITFFNDAIDC